MSLTSRDGNLITVRIGGCEDHVIARPAIQRDVARRMVSWCLREQHDNNLWPVDESGHLVRFLAVMVRLEVAYDVCE